MNENKKLILDKMNKLGRNKKESDSNIVDIITINISKPGNFEKFTIDDLFRETDNSIINKNEDKDEN